MRNCYKVVLQFYTKVNGLRLNVSIDQQLTAKLRRYIMLRFGENEAFFGKISEVVRTSLQEFLDKELPNLEEVARELK